MKYIFLAVMLLTQLFGGEKMSIYDIEVQDIDHNTVKLEKYQGKVMLIINVASKCGYTGQYAQLQDLYEKYSNKGLSILGFPCNQFLSQEPGTEEQIKNFCMTSFGVTFDMFSKINVNGKNTHPLYKFLKENAGGLLTDDIKWNFTKFLIDREGNVVERYAPSTKPKDIAVDIEALLQN